VRNGKNAAILSKKLATIITNVPIDFHEEEFRLKEWNKDLLKEIFTELEFKTLGKRVLGEDFNIGPVAVQGVQTDLFGNAVETKKKRMARQKLRQNRPSMKSAWKVMKHPLPGKIFITLRTNTAACKMKHLSKSWSKSCLKKRDLF
jgi:5'-3' exonuclease (including N-terminal domain of PolI)